MRFGQYELYDRFAKGAMAELYLGRARGEEGFEKPVAIKRILPHLAEDGRYVHMLLTEARIHASLSHKNIVQIHDLGISGEGEYFIVLEYVDGRDLGELLAVLHKERGPDGQPRRLDDAVALYVACEAGEGVHFAHEMRGADGKPLGLVHRDISPSNLLLSYAGEVKLSDFGVAKRATDESVVSSLKGELRYMSPEQARGAALDRRSDIFSLGAVLFEMLTGSPLRELEDEVDCWQQVASGLTAPPSRFRADLPPALEALLTRALAPDPRDRFPDARAFADACRAALHGLARPASGEAAELKVMLHRMLPPGSPAARRPPSRVIRLASDPWCDETVPDSGIPLDFPTRPPPAPAPPEPTLPESPRPSLAEVQRAVLVAPPQLRPARSAMPTPLGSALLSPQPTTVLRRTRRAGWLVLAGLLVALGLGAWAFHVVVLPLPVAAVWHEPAELEVESQPPGAELHLDGKPVGQSTPARVSVRRDRGPHVIELHKPGFLPTRKTLYFHRTVELRSSVPLLPAATSAPAP